MVSFDQIKTKLISKKKLARGVIDMLQWTWTRKRFVSEIRKLKK